MTTGVYATASLAGDKGQLLWKAVIGNPVDLSTIPVDSQRMWFTRLVHNPFSTNVGSWPLSMIEAGGR